MTKRHIVAMGGSGFSRDPHNPSMDQFVLGLTGKVRPRVCFIPTASGDSDAYVERFYSAFKKHSCIPTHLSLFRGQTPEIEKLILEQDVIYVGGGNTRNLLTLWKDWGVDTAIRKAYSQGAVLAGTSAGCICWFEQGVTDSVPGSLNSLDCMGILSGSACPHYDGEVERRPSYTRLLQDGKISPGIAIEDGAAAHYVDEQFSEIVCSHPEKKAYTLSLTPSGTVEEKALQARYLGGHCILIRRAAMKDALAIHDAHMRSIREVCSRDHTSEEISGWGNRPYSAERYEAAISGGKCFVIEDHGKIEGFAQYSVNEIASGSGKNATIQGMYLTPLVVGRGYGKTLMTMMLEEIRALGIKEVDLRATLTGQKFYSKFGFSPSGPMETTEYGGSTVRGTPMKLGL